MELTKSRKQLLLHTTKIVLVLAVVLFLPFFSNTVNAKEEKVVRVAYVLTDGYQEGEGDEPKNGYGYEYLQKIATYTGWKYEYVYGSFIELMEGVENGTIDLMGNISMTKDRLDRFDYSLNPQGSEYYLLVTNREDSLVDPFDISTLSGKKISVTRGSVQEEMLTEYLRDNNINSVEYVYYESFKDRENALAAGDIDALVTSNLSVHIPASKDWSLVSVIGSSDFYFITNKNKPWLKTELDKAQKEILDLVTNYNLLLNIKYHSNNISKHIPLTQEEASWIEENGTVKVGYLQSMKPYSFTDPATGQMSGMYRDFLDSVTETYGVSFEYIPYLNFEDMMNAVKNHDIDLATPMYFDYWSAERYEVLLADSIVDSSIHVVSKGKLYSGIKKIGISTRSVTQIIYTDIFYPNTEIVRYPSLSDCFQGVYDGEVDCTFVNSDVITVRDQELPLLSKLDVRDMHHSVDFSMAVSRDHVELLTIINKMIAMTSETETSARMIRHAHNESKFNLSSFISYYGLEIIIGISIIFTLITVFGVRSLNKTKKRKQELELALSNYEKADHDRRHDYLTGLQNRQDLFDMLKETVAGNHPPINAMFMMDVDDFKKFNDSKGHVAGDECLQAVSKALINYGLTNNITFYRYGGEEILGVSIEGEKSPSLIANEIIDLIRSLNIKREDNQNGMVTVSLGYTTNSSRYEKMVDYADEAMYYSKKHGKNKATCFEEI